MSNLFFYYYQPMLKSGLMPRSEIASVHVWSPVISQCSKTCGNGKWEKNVITFLQNLHVIIT